ncbi:MAG: lytic murein transglycosylase [Variibacter sp.]|nr:lytic murein transglycosylase [Variibacter sp.]
MIRATSLSGRAGALAVCLTAWMTAHAAIAAPDPAFTRFLASLAPEAARLGVSPEVFARETRGLEPDLTLPDLVIPGRPPREQGAQAEFVQTPAEYLREATIERLAAQGRKLAAQHKATLARIEREFGVPGPMVLAIWGRETAYGAAKLPHDGVRVLATQAWLGRRKEQFRQEFILALRLIEERHAARADLRSSWAGAMGLTQFLPSDFYRSAVDFDGDGRRDIWRSVPDALASAAKQLVDKGWEPGRRWAYEVRVPASVDCTTAQPSVTRPLGEWVRAGFTPAYGRRLSAAEAAEPASLLLPAGLYGPGFLTPKNYYVLKEYNFSDLYVLFVGHLSERIADPRPFETPWQKLVQMRTAQVEAMQRRLTERGLYGDKIDGKAGMLTRAALGRYQKANGLKVDCWPTDAVLRHMQANPSR